MKKFLLFTFTMMLLCGSTAWGQDDANSDGYHDGDVAVVNAIIANNELDATPDDPASWDFAFWDDATPQRIAGLRIDEKSLTGSLNVSGLAALTWLDCLGNQLNALDVSGLAALTELYCSDNLLTALEVAGCTALAVLWCNTNQLAALDVSNNTALINLYCSGNQLTTLDVSNNTNLKRLECVSNLFTALDVSNNTALTELYCYTNQLTDLDVSNNTALTHLICFGNQLTTLDVSNNTVLTSLSCSNNLLTELDCSFKQLIALDVSNNPALTELNCSMNLLTALDVSNNTALISLNCGGNQLTTLDVSNNTALNWLNCYNNQLTTLDVSDNTALTTLNCLGNLLTALDVSNNPALINLNCGWNQLSTLDISNNSASIWVECSMNQLTEMITPGGYTVSVPPAADGNVEIRFYDNLGRVNLTATPNSGYTFAEWAADNEEATFDPANETITALQLPGTAPEPGEETITVTAEFRAVKSPAEPAEYTILAWAGDNGTITPTGAVAVLEGDSAVFTFIPDEGYSVDVVTVDGEAVPRENIVNNRYTFKDVAGYHEITVTFRAGIPTANEDVEAGLKAYARDGQLYVSGLTPGEVWSVYSVTGAIIYQGTADGSEAVIPLPARGIYIIKAGGSTVKVAAVN